MITAIGQDEDGTPLIYMGLTPRNIERLTAGQRIDIPQDRLQRMGFAHPARLVIEALPSVEAGLERIKAVSPNVRHHDGGEHPQERPTPPGVTLIDAGHCPVCKTHLGAHMDPRGADKPKAGDPSICAHCTSFLVMTEAMTLREMSIEEVAQLEDAVRSELTRARKYFQSRQAGRPR